MNRRLSTILVLIVALVTLIFSIRSCSKHKRKKNEVIEMTKTVEDTLVNVLNEEDSSTTTKTKVIETEDVNVFIDLPNKDSIILALQEEVAKYKKKIKNNGSVTNVKTVTKWRTKVKTETVFLSAIDTVFINDTVFVKENNTTTIKVFPTYMSSFDLEGWVKGEIKAGVDSTEIYVSVKDAFTLVIGEEKASWFKKKRPYAMIHSLNPYSKVKDFKTYKVKTPKVSNFGIGPYVGFGIGKLLKPEIQIGIGLHYDLLRL